MFSAANGEVVFSAGRSNLTTRKGKLRSSARALISATYIESLEPRQLFATVPTGFQTDQAYGGGITNGTAMDFSPDGRLWVTTQTGQVQVIQPNATTSTNAISLSVDSFFERGLLGIAFHPQFGVSNSFVYLFYTDLNGANPSFNKISRFEVSGNTILAGTETVMFSFNLLNAGNHNGGAIHFGPEGLLYAMHGENAVGSNAQSIANLLGKTIRIDVDAFVAGNPLSVIPTGKEANPTSFPGIAGSTSGINQAIWAVGLRNPYTFAFHPATGRMHINDVGQDSWEEVNLGAAGSNYGWPTTEGNTPPGNANVTYPLYTYQNTASAIAVTGGSFYDPAFNQFGVDYDDDYFFADLGAGWMRRLDGANSYAIHNTGGVGNGINWVTGASTIVDVKVTDTGSLLFLQRGGAQGVRIVRTINPQVASSGFLYDGVILPGAPHRVEFKFTNNVGASLQPSDLQLLRNGTPVDSSNVAVAYNTTTNTATFTFPGFTNGILPNGSYTATLVSSAGTPNVTDPEGDPLLADSVANFFVLAGDADHNGVIDFDDYSLIDNGFNNNRTGFLNGDFDYNGIVDFDDYSIIDNGFNNQNRPFALPTD
ncbi:MAG: PQQ-dependent sugar dehydrogenase [Anaerolineae bacterium]|nr:PQQ-dependent sugar dehydrogenase [Phycisphaerae bacterium]